MTRRSGPDHFFPNVRACRELVQSNQEEQGHQAVDRDNVDTHLAETAIMIVRHQPAGDLPGSSPQC